MIDLSGIARHLRLSVEQLRVAADLLEQGYPPGFIERYRADETGKLPHSTLWLLKLEVDRQLRLQASRERAVNQLPKDAQLDTEASKFLERATTEVEIEAALRTFRSRRMLSQNQESDKQASSLLEKMIEYQGPAPADLAVWAAEQLSLDAEAASQVLQHAGRLVGMLMHSDSNLNEGLRRTIQRFAQVRVTLCDPTQVNAGSDEDSHATDGEEAPANEAAGKPAAEPTASDVALSTDDSANMAVEAADVTAHDNSGEPAVASQVPVAEVPVAEVSVAEVPVAEVPVAEVPVAEVPADDGVAELVFSPAEKKLEKKLSKGAGKKKEAKVNKGAKKPVAKMTPRQRRRRWLISMLQPMKSLKCPLTKLSSYQQLMLGRGRRSQLCKTELDYDRRALVNLARDTFVTDKHPLAHWFAQMAEDSLEHSLQAKCELDAITDLEEIAADRLLVHSVDQLRHSLLQRPVRGHCILVVDCVGPKAAAVAVVGADGQVLAIDEIPCSASAGIVNQNVVRLGELVHQHRVTLVALTNGPARRFLVLSLRELMKQSSASGLRWTMADRGGADAYAVSRSALKELSAHNRRHRAAIWVARTLQDPLSELLKVDVNRLRLGSYQRELPQEPLKQLVRETIADCVCRLGLDVRTANVDQLSYVSGVALPQAQQIVGLAQQGTLGSRKELVEKVADWPEMRMRQAIGLLRVYGSEQPLDATLIHPDDYRLAERLVENTDLSAPPAVPAGWQARRATEQAETAIADAPVTAASPVASSVDPAAPAPDVSQAETPLGEVAQAEVAQTDTPSEDAAGAATTEPTVAAAESADPIASAEPVEAALVVAAEQPAVESPVPASEAVAATGAPTPGPLASWVEHPTAVAAAVARPEYPEDLSSDTASPTPTVDVEKLARGWQVGREKLRQIAGCLHDPFADPRLQHPPVPLMTEMPTLTNLQPGTCVWAVVIGVADFGAFVELAPDCSGLIHISRLSSHFIEDPHQAVQVGDLLMTWVVSVDDKKNRVALTALSPEQRATAAAMNAERKEQDEHRRRDRGNSGSHRPAGAAGGNAARGGAHGVAAAGRGAGDGRGRGPARDGDGRGGDGRRGGPGGRSRGGPGGRGQGRPAHAKTVVVTSKKPKANITDAMKEGEEPLRSFSDLMQFYQAKRTDEPTKETKSDQS